MKRRNYTLKKRILAGVMAGMMVFTQGIPLMEQFGITTKTVYAESAVVNEIEWAYNVLDDGTLEIAKGSKFGDKTEIIIPTEIDGMKVTSIGDNAFYECSSLSSVIIPDGVTSIGSSAFDGCSSLSSIEIPDSVTSIGNGAFRYCSSLRSIEIPLGVTRIADGAFMGCSSLTSIVIPDSVTRIGVGAIRECGNLSSIEIPDSVTSIGVCAFLGCHSLSSIEIPDSVTSIGSRALSYCSGLISIEIPSSVTSIGDGVLSRCSSLRSIEVDPDNKNYLSECDILYTKNKDELICCSVGKTGTITIPDSVTRIADCAFVGCSSLTSIEIPDSVTRIGEEAFSLCSSLRSIEVDPDNKNFSSECDILYTKNKEELIYCVEGKTGTITIPDSVTSIGDYAFDGCSSLSSIEIPSSVTRIGEFAFSDCRSLSSIVVPEGVTSIGYYTFYGCSSLSSIEIPSSVTSIEAYAFYYCSSLSSVVIPPSVTSIEFNAFSKCYSLSSIEIPSSVTSIDTSAFDYCDQLIIIAPINSYAHEFAISNEIPWKELADSTDKDEYEVYDEWQYKRVPNEQNDETTVTITKYLGTQKEVTIPTEINGMKVTAIEAEAFANTDLELVNIHEGIIGIGDNAFAGCSKLTIVAPFGSVAYMYAIQNNIPWRGLNGESNEDTSAEDQLWQYFIAEDGSVTIEAYLGTAKEVQIPQRVAGKKVASIAMGAFRNRTDIVSIKMPNTITYIGPNAFEGCTQLESIELSTSLPEVQKHTFFLCRSLKIVKIPDSVTKIGDSAFYGCTSLNTIEIPESVKTIGEYAFGECNDLTIYSDISAYAYDYAMDNGIKHKILVLNTIANSENVGQKDMIFKLYCRKAFAKGQLFNFEEKEANGQIKDSQFVKGSTTQNVAEYEVTLPYGNGISGIYGIFRKEGYQDYIIPNEVVWRWDAAQTKSFNIYMDDKREEEKENPYISAIFARSIKNKTYVDARAEELKFKEGEKFFIYMTASGADENTTYYLTQDENHKISSTTGFFKNEILYNTFQADKPIYAYMETGSGTASELIEVKLSKLELNQSALSVIESTSFTPFGPNGWSLTISDDIPLVGGSEIALDTPALPVGCSIKGDKVRISVGASIWGKEDDDETAEWKWKKLMELCDSFENKGKDFLKKKEEFGKLVEKVKYIANNGLPEDKKPEFKEPKKTNSFGVDIIGYIELEIIGNELKITKVSGTLSAEFAYKYTQQIMIAGIPAYFYVQAGGGAGVTLNFANLTGDPDLPYNFEAVINIEPSLTIGGGAGESGVASIGLYGKASLPIEVNLKDKSYDLSLTGEFGAEGEFFGLTHRQKIVSGMFKLVSGYYGSAKAAAKFTNKLYSPTVTMNAMVCENITAASRAYADTTTAWSAEPLDSEPDGKFTVSELQKSVYSNSQCQIISFGEKMMMAWIEDCIERDVYNRTRLMYAVYDETTGTWSEAKPVCDDETMDASPKLATDGEELYIVWQNISQVMNYDDEDIINHLKQSSEIMLAKYNAETGEFDEVTSVTDNTTYDYAPAVTIEDGNAVVYWVNSQNMDFAAGTLSIWKQTAGEESIALYSGLNYIPSLVCDGASVSYNMDADGELATVEDVYLYTNGEKVSDAESTILCFTYGELNNGNTLFYANDSNLYYVENGESKPVFYEARRINNNLKVINNGIKTSVVWSELTEDGSELYTSEYVDGIWGQPVLLGSMEESITNMDIAYSGDVLYGIFNRTMQVENTEEDGIIGYEKQTDLCQFTLSDFSDLEMDISFIDESAFEKNTNTTIGVFVKNKGRNTIQNVLFNITDTLGTNVDITKELNLLPGEQTIVNVEYLVPENFDMTNLTVSAMPEDATDMNLENNTVTKQIGHCDMQVEQLQLAQIGKAYVISTHVENGSLFDARDVSVDIMLGSKENEPVATVSLGDIPAGEKRYVEFTLEESNVRVNCNEEDICYVYFSVASNDTEALLSNNTSVIAIEKKETTQLEEEPTNPEEKPTEPEETTTEKSEETTTEKSEETTTKKPEETTTEKSEETTTKKPEETTTEKSEETTTKKPEETTTEKSEEITTTKPEETTTKKPEETTTEKSEETTTKKPEETTTEKSEETTTKKPEETTTEKPEETTTKKAEETTTEKPEESTTEKSEESTTEKSEEATTEQKPTKVKITSATLACNKYIYNGSARKPAITVKAGTKKLKNGTDYTVAYKNNINPGTATVTVTGKGKYTGTITKTFKINLSKVTGFKQSTTYATTKISMKWNKVKGAGGYAIYRASTKNGYYKYLKSVTTNATSHAGLKAGSKYYYKVRAYKTVNKTKLYGAYSDTKSMLTKPAAPVGFKIVLKSRTAKISWSKSTGAKGYEVYMSTKRNGSYTRIKNAGSSTRAYNKTGLVKGKKYYFKMRAYTKTGTGVKVYSGYSKIKAVKVK